jgi:hypothetical protein
VSRTIRLHASGPVETFQFTDLPGFYPDATIIGVAPQWDDASDATYARSQTDVDSTDFRSVTARLDALPSSVTLAQVVSITVHLRFDTAHPSGETSRAYEFGIYDDAHRSSADRAAYSVSSTTVTYPDPPNDDLTHEVDYVIYPSDGATIDPPTVLAALQSGAWLNPSTIIRSPWQRAALTVYEAWVDVEVAAATAIRLWPRDDSRGINAATRVYPQPRAGRVVGGQP